MSNINNRPPNKISGLYVGESHANGGILSIVDNISPVEIEGNEYHICSSAIEDERVFEFKQKTNKEILDELFKKQGCVFEQGKSNSGDFIICKLVVLDKEKRNIKGTVKEIITKFQAEKSCELPNDSLTQEVFNQGGSVDCGCNHQKKEMGGRIDKYIYLGFFDKQTDKLLYSTRIHNNNIGSEQHVKLIDEADDRNLLVKNITQQQHENNSVFDISEDSFDYRIGGAIKNGKIVFDSDFLPSKKIYNYAKNIKDNYPRIWNKAGNIFGNEAFERLEKVIKRGYWLSTEKPMFIKWQSFLSRHQHDYRLNGIIATLKWIGEVNKGWDYMKKVLDEEISKYENGGRLSLLSPNGKKSNLSASNYAVVRTEEFKKWFGDWLLLAEAKMLSNNINGFYKKLFIENPQEVLFEASQQAHSSSSERKGAELVFGKRLVEIATKLYPNIDINKEFYQAVSSHVDENNEPLFNEQNNKTKFLGFKSDIMSEKKDKIDLQPYIDKIAKKHNISPDKIKRELEIGIHIEKEHENTFKRLKAGIIDIDQAIIETSVEHILEAKDYYTQYIIKYPNEDPFKNHEITIDNYFIDTNAVFSFKSQGREAISDFNKLVKQHGLLHSSKDSDSKYVYDGKKIYRLSDHWGKLGKCDWKLDIPRGVKIYYELILASCPLVEFRANDK